MNKLDLNELLSNFKATNQLLFAIAEKHNILNAVINDDDCILQDIIDNNNSFIDSFKNHQLNDGWISVDNYLPIPESNYYDNDFKPENFYLIQLKDGFVNTACYVHYDDCDLDKYWFVSCTLSVVENKYTVQEIGFDCYEIDEVKYWKPHPQPPQE